MHTDSWLAIARGATFAAIKAAVTPLARSGSFIVPPVISVRFAMPTEGETIVHDQLRGTITFRKADIDDAILLKSNGLPTYHLAHIVDDHLMKITHLIHTPDRPATHTRSTRQPDHLGTNNNRRAAASVNGRVSPQTKTTLRHGPRRLKRSQSHAATLPNDRDTATATHSEPT
nr:glutamate--tRNA ligase family protein [Dictyobacter vulcani]